jgi:hypothetical protein
MNYHRFCSKTFGGNERFPQNKNANVSRASIFSPSVAVIASGAACSIGAATRKAPKGDGRHGCPLAGSGMFTNGGDHHEKKIFGLQRHKLLMGDRHESDIDVVGPYLCPVRRPGSNAR